MQNSWVLELLQGPAWPTLSCLDLLIVSVVSLLEVYCQDYQELWLRVMLVGIAKHYGQSITCRYATLFRKYMCEVSFCFSLYKDYNLIYWINFVLKNLAFFLWMTKSCKSAGSKNFIFGDLRGLCILGIINGAGEHLKIISSWHLERTDAKTCCLCRYTPPEICNALFIMSEWQVSLLISKLVLAFVLSELVLMELLFIKFSYFFSGMLIGTPFHRL